MLPIRVGRGGAAPELRESDFQGIRPLISYVNCLSQNVWHALTVILLLSKMKPTGCPRGQWILSRQAHLTYVKMSVLLLRAHHATLAQRCPHDALRCRGVPHYKRSTARWRLYDPRYPRLLLVHLQLAIPVLWHRIRGWIVHLDLKALLAAAMVIAVVHLHLNEASWMCSQHYSWSLGPSG